MKRIHLIIIGLSLVISGLVMSVYGFSEYHEDVKVGPYFILCPVGFIILIIGAIIFFALRRGNVP